MFVVCLCHKSQDGEVVQQGLVIFPTGFSYHSNIARTGKKIVFILFLRDTFVKCQHPTLNNLSPLQFAIQSGIGVKKQSGFNHDGSHKAGYVAVCQTMG